MNIDFNLSFEFFPARTEQGQANFLNARDQLAVLKPDYFSVTFGAGGSTRDHTYDTVVGIQQQTQIPAAPHLSCIGATREELGELLASYQAEGINRIVALRGDMPSGMVHETQLELHYANELVAFIREQTGDHFHIEVAAYPEFHPQAKSAATDLNYFKQKVEAGANSAITQYFYNQDAYFRFLDATEKLGIDIPIIPGIMPISNYAQLMRFSDMCGAEIPRWLAYRLHDLEDQPEALNEFGLEVVTDLCKDLLAGGAPGLHFYTLNRADSCSEIIQRLQQTDFAAA